MYRKTYRGGDEPKGRDNQDQVNPIFNDAIAMLALNVWFRCPCCRSVLEFDDVKRGASERVFER